MCRHLRVRGREEGREAGMSYGAEEVILTESKGAITVFLILGQIIY